MGLTYDALLAAALALGEVDEPWAHGVRIRIQPGLFNFITSEANR